MVCMQSIIKKIYLVKSAAKTALEKQKRVFWYKIIPNFLGIRLGSGHL
jgi:hypothetical protein